MKLLCCKKKETSLSTLVQNQTRSKQKQNISSFTPSLSLSFILDTFSIMGFRRSDTSDHTSFTTSIVPATLQAPLLISATPSAFGLLADKVGSLIMKKIPMETNICNKKGFEGKKERNKNITAAAKSKILLAIHASPVKPDDRSDG
jgi:hypothetical protein